VSGSAAIANKAFKTMPDSFPKYTIGERVADGVLHVIGVIASLVAAVALVIFAFRHLPSLSFVSVAIYGVGLVAVFGCSAAYHLINRPALKAILRRFDQAAIYVKIAATYTPFAVVKLGGLVGYSLLGSVWSIGVLGVATKLLWPERFVRTSYVLYLALGWSGILVLVPLTLAVTPSVLLLLAIGGCLYTIGVAFHLWSKLRYHNAIWHAFVLAASCFHFAAVTGAVAIVRGS
jgi:hemolysin III